MRRVNLFMFTTIVVAVTVFLGCDNSKLYAQSDSVRIVQHLTKITKTDGFRNHRNISLLNQTAEYIFSVFSQYADTTYYQPYQVEGETYLNVVCRLGSANNKPLVVVGAHYDTVNTEGADDNTSGVVGLLELVRLLSKEKLNYPIEIVAYTLEEPPFFLTENMGSYIHAKSLHDAGIQVYGMVTFEMIGYFDDKPGSQRYPNPAETMIGWSGYREEIYGNVGNFIMLAYKTDAGTFVRNFSANFKNMATINTHIFEVPPSESDGLAFSDHLNYWKFNYDALMITDTAFFRNLNYHRNTDTIETLDIRGVMKVIDATALAIINLK